MDFSALRAFMDFMAQERTPGNAIEVYLKGEKVFSYASGFADLENRVRLCGNEYYFIYSCSKVAAAAAGMQLLEQGKLLATDPLYAYFPEFREMQIRQGGELRPAKNPITIGDLFSMTSGIDYGYEKTLEEIERVSGRVETLDYVRGLAKKPLNFEPGTEWEYGLSHDILAGVIEVVSGMKFSEYMRKNIFEPLEMQETTYRMTPEIADRMASLYTFEVADGASLDPVAAQRMGNAEKGNFRKIEKNNFLVFSDSYDSGGAGIITTVSDYAKFAAALANGGTGLNGERILSPRTVELMKRNRLNLSEMKGFNWKQLTGYGYGFGVRTMVDPAAAGSLSSVGEFGWGGAAGSSVWIDTELNLGVFYAQHCLNPREEYYQPRLRNILYSCL